MIIHDICYVCYVCIMYVCIYVYISIYVYILCLGIVVVFRCPSGPGGCPPRRRTGTGSLIIHI